VLELVVYSAPVFAVRGHFQPASFRPAENMKQ
jgi:hypothetical protein